MTGFEPLDILQGVFMCVKQLEEGRAEVENQYARAVRPAGNLPAQQLIREVFEVVPRKWRGVGEIPQSGLGLRPAYHAFDAERRFGVADQTIDEPAACISGLIMQGLKKPHECPAFAGECTPEHPLGATMVSSEGACAAYYRYRRGTGHFPQKGAFRCQRSVGSEARATWDEVLAMSVELTNGGSCPVPIARYTHVLMAHGGGGQLTNQLIEQMFVAAFANPALDERHDGAELRLGGARLAFTTDSYVVRPLFFPGGDIGALAVNGTVNDLAMCGARPRFLSAGFILEEGLEMETLWRVVSSMRDAATRAGVQLVTGDTKVVDRGKGDGLYVNTAGVGLIEHDVRIGPGQVRAGDVVLVSGDIGRHGMAVMAVREGLEFESAIESDCAPVAEPVLALLDAGVEVHCLRDLTRGGLASALVEIARTSGRHIRLEETAVPIREDVRGASEILGFDPFYVANEGRFAAFVAPASVNRALEILRGFDVSAGAVRVGTVADGPAGLVTARSAIGASRVVDLLSGEQLPRIC